MGLVSELKSRKVLRMAALYAVAAWLIMQVAEVVLTLAALPNWAGQVVLVLLAIGFPVALIFSWFYEVTPEGIGLDTDGQPADSSTQDTGRRIDFIAISLLSAALMLFAWHTWWPTTPTDSSVVPDEAIESIAVLPLNNLSNDPAQEYFVEGMQDALITRLSRMKELRVISKTSTLRYQATGKSIPEIARELNVDALIEGSVLRDANRVRITAKLIRGSEDEHIWANSYDRDLDHVLTIINEISMAVADEIEVAVKQQERKEWPQSSSVNLKVHELVLQGDHYFDRFMFDQSLRHYQQAVDLDGSFAPAHAGVSGSYLLQGFLGRAASTDAIPKAREAALKAISLDSNSAGAYSSLGFIQLYFDWDWEAAKRNLLRALELSPNDSLVRHAYADYLIVMGEVDESLQQVEIGLLYDPFSPMARTVVDFHKLLARQFDEVIKDGQVAIARDPESFVSRSAYQEALWLAGEYQDAFAAYKKTWGRDKELLTAMENGYAESGYNGVIIFLAEALAARVPEFYDYVSLAKYYARAGIPDAALKWLEEAYQHRQPQILHINAMAEFDELHSDAEFQNLLRRIGFPATSPP